MTLTSVKVCSLRLYIFEIYYNAKHKKKPIIDSGFLYDTNQQSNKVLEK